MNGGLLSAFGVEVTKMIERLESVGFWLGFIASFTYIVFGVVLLNG